MMIREQCIPPFPFFVNQGYNYQKKCVYIYNASFLPFSLLLRHSVLWEIKMFIKSHNLEITLQLDRYVSIEVTQHF